MAPAPRRRLTEKLKKRIHRIRIQYEMSHQLYEPVDDADRMVGERTWTALVYDGDDQIAWVKVHRVPLNHLQPVAGNLDDGPYVPHTPAYAIMNAGYSSEGRRDQLKPGVLRRLSPYDQETADSLDATFLIVETGWLDPHWHGLDMPALFLCTVLRELRSENDVVAASFQLPMANAYPGYKLISKAEAAAIKSEWRAALAYAGFARYQGATMLLADTRLPGSRVVGLQRRFGFPHVIDYWWLYTDE